MESGSPKASITNYRFTQQDIAEQGLPSWALNRTASEVANLADQFYRQSFNALDQQPQAQPVQDYNYNTYDNQPDMRYQEQSQPQAAGLPTQDDWARDPERAQQMLMNYQNQQNAAYLNNLYSQNAQMAREMVRQQEADTFSRYGPEIDAIMQKVGVEARSAEAYKMAVGMVKANHINDLVNDETERRIRERMEAGSLSSPTPPSEEGQNQLNYVDELPPRYRNLLEQEQVIRNGQFTPTFTEFIDKVKKPDQSRNEAIKEWVENAKSGDVIFSATGGGLRVENEQSEDR